MKIVILYSAGLDSLIMKQYAKVKFPDAEVKYIYYKHGAEAEEQEIVRLPDFVDVRHVDWLNDTCKPLPKKSEPQHGAIFIPGRNLVFAALAACQELPDEIWMGTLYDEVKDISTDKNHKFRKDTSDLLTYVLSPFSDGVQIVFPFVNEGWAKEHSVRWALKNGLTQEDLINSVSCWHHDGLPCGVCMQCFRRYMVFKLNGFEETYHQHPFNSDRGRELLKIFLENEPVNSDEANTVRMIASVTPLLEESLQKYIKDTYAQI